MFDGEFESLKAIYETNTIKVPKPLKVLEGSSHGTLIVMEHLDLKHCSAQGKLGSQLAK